MKGFPVVRIPYSLLVQKAKAFAPFTYRLAWNKGSFSFVTAPNVNKKKFCVKMYLCSVLFQAEKRP